MPFPTPTSSTSRRVIEARRFAVSARWFQGLAHLRHVMQFSGAMARTRTTSGWCKSEEKRDDRRCSKAARSAKPPRRAPLNRDEDGRFAASPASCARPRAANCIHIVAVGSPWPDREKYRSSSTSMNCAASTALFEKPARVMRSSDAFYEITGFTRQNDLRQFETARSLRPDRRRKPM